MISRLSATASLADSALSVSAADVALDEGAVPFAQATLTVPYSAALADALDPRESVRVGMSLTQDYFGAQTIAQFNVAETGTISDFNTRWSGRTIADLSLTYASVWNDFGLRVPFSRTLDLGVRSRTINHRDATIEIVLASDEALLLDSGRVAATGTSPSTLTVLAAVQLVLSSIIGVYTLDTTEGAQTITAESAVWQPGVSGWDYLQPLTASAGLRLWCDEQRVWHLAAPETIQNPGQVRLFSTGTITDASDTVSRAGDAWYEAVVVKYSWTDSSNVAHVQYDVAGDTGAGRVLLVEQDRPYPRAGEAAARLRKLSGQGRVLDVNAVADFSAYPATSTQLTLPDTPTQTGWIAAVNWHLPADEMSVKTRELIDTPDSAWTFGDVGIAWSDVPTGTDWSEFDWSVL